MKNFKSQFTLIVLFILATINLGAQDIISMEPFDGVSVLGNIEVTLEKGEKPQVIVETYDISEDDVSIFVKEGRLKLQLLKTIFRDNQEVKIKVIYAEELDFIKVGAGADLSSKEVIKADDLEIKAMAGAEIELEINVEKLRVSSSEGADIELSGTAQRQYATAATGGEYDGLNLQCEETHAKANTGGELAIVALSSLYAKANTGGSIEYAGHPETKNINSAFTGKIRRVKKIFTQ